MRNANEHHGAQERGAKGTMARKGARAAGMVLEVLGPLGVICVAAVATAFIVSSCGGEQGSAKSAATTSSRASESSTAAVVASTQPLPAPSGAVEQRPTPVAKAAGLPPDLSVEVPDTSVVPGEAVTLSVEATPDVAQIAVSDGNGDALPMVRNEDTGEWTVQYRVPLKPRHERIGLSVTARTEENRWRRVWVFLHVAGQEAAESGDDSIESVDVD